jgi:hypothetical protein
MAWRRAWWASGLGLGRDAVRRGSFVVAALVQSKIPFWTTRPRMFVGADLETWDSVSAREVASVPPRREP